MSLSGNQRRFLRALGHHLDPVVQVGHQGVTDALVKALAQALRDHELVKVKLAQSIEDRPEIADALVEKSGAELAQTLGRTVLLYKARAERPAIVLPSPRQPGEGKGFKSAETRTMPKAPPKPTAPKAAKTATRKSTTRKAPAKGAGRAAGARGKASSPRRPR